MDWLTAVSRRRIARRFPIAVLLLCTADWATSEAPLVTAADNSITAAAGAATAAAHQAATANGTAAAVAAARSLGDSSGGGGKVLFPDRSRPAAAEGRHAAVSPWQHGLLVGTAERHAPAISRAVCQLYPDAGHCSGHVTAWYWDPSEERCRTFLYGGCKGNGNNFITQEECRAVCDIAYIQKVTGSSQLLPRPDNAKHHRLPNTDSYFSPVTGDGRYRPRPGDYPSHPDTGDYPSHHKTRPKYPTYAETHDYPTYPGASSRPSHPASGDYPSRPSPSGHSIDYPSLFGTGGGRGGLVHLQQIGEVDISGLGSPLAGHTPLPDRPTGCPATDTICDYHQSGYPSSAIDSIVGRYTSELRQMYEQLYHHPPERFVAHSNDTQDDLRSRTSADSVSARHGPGEFVCESEVRYSRPGWARSFTGLWQLVLNTASLPQAVRTERCRYEGRRCNYLAPCMSSVCVQRFAIVKMLCADPLNPFVRPSMQDVRIPSGCSCYVTGSPSDLWREPWVRSNAEYNSDTESRPRRTTRRDD